MLIEVKETHPPGAGKKVAHIIAADGQKYEIWPEMLASLQVGRTYEVAVDERQYMGRPIRKITKATLAAGTTPSPTAAAPIAPAQTASGEVEFVARILGAMILKGEVAPFNKRQMADATLMLRGLYQYARFDEPWQPLAEAAE